MSFFENTRKPEGFGGKIMVDMMNIGHSAVARWGLRFLKLTPDDKVLECGRYGGGAGAEAGALYPGDAGETGGGHGTGRGTRFCEGDDRGGTGIYRQRRGHSGPRGGAGGENGVKNPVQSSHIINSGGVVPKLNIWYNIPVKMRRRVCPIRTDAPLFGIGYGGRGKEGRLEPQDYSGRAGETA